MNCEEFKAVFQDVERPGVLDEESEGAILTHAESCIPCARGLHEGRILSAALRSLGRADETHEAPPYIEARLRRAFRAQAGWRARRSRMHWWMAAAASAILALGASIGWRYATAPVAHKDLRRAATTRTAGGAQPTIPSKTTPVPRPSQPKRRESEHPRRAARGPVLYARQQTLKPEDLSDFVPLPYADLDAPLGSGEVVRIQLSASSLALLGIPVSDSSSSEGVTADVALGEDGVARAIRFVSGPVVSYAPASDTPF